MMGWLRNLFMCNRMAELNVAYLSSIVRSIAIVDYDGMVLASSIDVDDSSEDCFSMKVIHDGKPVYIEYRNEYGTLLGRMFWKDICSQGGLDVVKGDTIVIDNLGMSYSDKSYPVNPKQLTR